MKSLRHSFPFLNPRPNSLALELELELEPELELDPELINYPSILLKLEATPSIAWALT